MVSVDIIRARRVSWTRGMRWTVQHCQNPLQISCRNVMRPGPRQIQPRRIQ
ncbi:hypothetical protein EV363DRAFT_1166716 [Boletus edulis]|nr:hypothetical protein EV363DRAFT_1166716 [Boletus edulis]